ncbi:hypothetical protein AKO1_009157, partial [Acrasis kona]
RTKVLSKSSIRCVATWFRSSKDIAQYDERIWRESLFGLNNAYTEKYKLPELLKALFELTEWTNIKESDLKVETMIDIYENVLKKPLMSSGVVKLSKSNKLYEEQRAWESMDFVVDRNSNEAKTLIRRYDFIKSLSSYNELLLDKFPSYLVNYEKSCTNLSTWYSVLHEESSNGTRIMTELFNVVIYPLKFKEGVGHEEVRLMCLNFFDCCRGFMDEFYSEWILIIINNKIK